MKLAVIGSRNVRIKNIEDFIMKDVDEIVSGGAKGVDTCAAEYALKNHIKLKEFLPQYSVYGRSAPLRRNEEIADYADEAIAFWNGYSRGTLYTIKCFQRRSKKVKIVLLKQFEKC